MTNKLKRRLDISFFVFIISFIFLMFQIKVNISESSPPGIYLANRFSKKFNVGDYIVYKSPKNYEKYADENLRGLDTIKKVYAKQGDVIYRLNNEIYINNNKTVNIVFTKIPSILTSGVIAKGDYLTLSDKNTSLDGRYYGTINEKDIKYKAYLIYRFKKNEKKEVNRKIDFGTFKFEEIRKGKN